MPLSTQRLRQTVADLVSDRPSRRATDAFVDHGRRIATAYLRRRIQSGRLRLDQFDLTAEDLALDCLADLFRRDDAGRFVRICAYAESVGWEALDDAGLEIAMRRLVFSATNEGLFRRYRENDPTVGRIIRTLKHHASTNDRVALRRLRAAHLLELRRSTADQRGRPMMPPEVLEAHLHGLLDRSGRLSEVLDVVADLLEDHPFYAPSAALSDLALSVRNVLARRGESQGEALADSGGVEERDFRALMGSRIEHAQARVRDEMEALYVERRGISPPLYASYMRAVGDILRAQFVEPGAPDLSYREAFISHAAAVGSAEYRRRHQAVLEYLVNLTRAQVLQRAAPLV